MSKAVGRTVILPFVRGGGSRSARVRRIFGKDGGALERDYVRVRPRYRICLTHLLANGAELHVRHLRPSQDWVIRDVHDHRAAPGDLMEIERELSPGKRRK